MYFEIIFKIVPVNYDLVHYYYEVLKTYLFTFEILESSGFTVIDKGAGMPSIAFGGLTHPCLRGFKLFGKTSYPASYIR